MTTLPPEDPKYKYLDKGQLSKNLTSFQEAIKIYFTTGPSGPRRMSFTPSSQSDKTYPPVTKMTSTFPSIDENSPKYAELETYFSDISKNRITPSPNDNSYDGIFTAVSDCLKTLSGSASTVSPPINLQLPLQAVNNPLQSQNVNAPQIKPIARSAHNTSPKYSLGTESPDVNVYFDPTSTNTSPEYSPGTESSDVDVDLKPTLSSTPPHNPLGSSTFENPLYDNADYLDPNLQSTQDNADSSIIVNPLNALYPTTSPPTPIYEVPVPFNCNSNTESDLQSLVSWVYNHLMEFFSEGFKEYSKCLLIDEINYKFNIVKDEKTDKPKKTFTLNISTHNKYGVLTDVNNVAISTIVYTPGKKPEIKTVYSKDKFLNKKEFKEFKTKLTKITDTLIKKIQQINQGPTSKTYTELNPK